MPFNLFRKKKQPEPEKPAVAPQEEEPKPEAPPQPVEIKQEPVAPPQEPAQEAAASAQETAAPPAEPKPQAAEASGKTYLKAMPLRELADVEKVKNEVKNGNIIILRVTPLANKSIEDVKTAVNDLYQFSESIGGDIARLGEERVVICPKSIRIWREKTPTPVSNEPAPTAA
jgi:SepF-like predicted cell division protein (DUF552 family)